MKKIYITLLMVLVSLVSEAQYGIYEMILYYPIENAVSGDTVIDISGHNNFGIMHNVELTTDRFGNKNSAISFNGIDSYISMSCPDFSQPEYCYSLWAKIYTNPPYGESDVLISIGTDYGIDHFLMNTNHYSLNDHVGWLGGGYHADQTHAIVRTQIPSIENEWVLVTYFRDSEMLKIYINGDYFVVSEENVQTPYFGDDFVGNIGRRVNGTQYYLGAMDDIRIYEKMLDTSDIMDIYLQEGIPVPLVDAGNNQIISSSTSEIQITGSARLFKSLSWKTTGDGTFSDTTVEAPIYFPGINDMNSSETILTMNCTGYSENDESISDTIKLINPTLVPDQLLFNANLSVFPNPLTRDKSLTIESKSITLSTIQEVKL